jgi:hypothetical protein
MVTYILINAYAYSGLIIMIFLDSKTPAKTRGEFIFFACISMVVAPLMLLPLFEYVINHNKWLNENI